MKKLSIILGLFLLAALCAHGQELTYSYGYDAAGNRTTTTVIIIESKVFADPQTATTPQPLPDLRPDGETILVYPNPTSGIIHVERQGENIIGNYHLTDANGRTIEQGTCKDRVVAINLSQLGNGIYFLDFGSKQKTIHYKVIKQ